MSKNKNEVIAYFSTPESRKGYKLFLGGTKHFGYYEKGDHFWQVDKALRQMEEKLAGKIDLPQGSRVLDAGCGVGDVASYLASNYGYKVEGVDILDSHIEEARQRVGSRGLEGLVNVQLMSFEDLKFPPDSFDAVYTMETLVHSGDPESALAEFHRVLKPGGKLIMFEYSHDPYDEMPERAVDVFEFINKYAAMPAFQRFTHGTQVRLMEEAGFDNITVEDILNRIAPMMKLFNAAALVPYNFVKLLGRQSRFINSMSAVEFFKYRKHIKYNIYSATK